MEIKLKYGVFADQNLIAAFRVSYDAKVFGESIKKILPNNKITYKEVE